ncbi:MAG: desulfoferrodoxin family protein [Bacilli bacterium]|nr:desulfoferrodoxin family protein [Bacilli bacterium]
MKEVKFYVCKHCGNLVLLLRNGGGRLVCCGEPMKLLEANSSDGAYEKHVPEVKIEASGKEITVQVGSVIHPMTEAHFIEWVYVQTKKGGQLKYFAPGDAPVARFTFVEDEVVAVYEHCNLHGLFVKEV